MIPAFPSALSQSGYSGLDSALVLTELSVLESDDDEHPVAAAARHAITTAQRSEVDPRFTGRMLSLQLSSARSGLATY
ncbi:hypothetical protein C5E51_28160 [Nocardia nova]|nr:hypothetical protein C5E51_28160 [Nocardia nova]